MSDLRAALFYEKLQQERSTTSKVNSLTLTKLKYDGYIEKVKKLKTATKKESNDVRFLRRYDIYQVNGITKLIHPVTVQNRIRYYVFDEELFGVLNEAHISTGHGGRDRMIQQLRQTFQNVTTKDILLFLSLCELCVKKFNNKKKGLVAKDLKRQGNEAFHYLEQQDQIHSPVEKGTSVRIPVPNDDRGRGDARSILGVVLQVVDDGLYRIGTRNGILKQLFSRSQFSKCPTNIIQENEVPMDKTIAVRTVATSQSLGSGQGFFKCSCNSKCKFMKCICKKKGVLCNSKCHKSLPCCNK